MPVRSLDELRPEVRAQVEAYLARVQAGFCAIPPDLAEDTLHDTMAHFLDNLDADSTLEDVERVREEIGEPDEYAVALCDALANPVSSADDGDNEQAGPGHGRVLGMPYDIRVPTPERVQRRWWNTTDPRIVVPRVFGVGWDINFGALAVRLGFIRPDDEDEPFASVPEVWLYSALAVPAAFTLLIGWLWVAYRAQLPSQLPTHWGFSGKADDFGDAAGQFYFSIAIAGIPTAWALWSTVFRRSAAARVLTSALAALLSAVAAGTFTTSVLWGLGNDVGWLVPATILAAFGVPFGMLVVLAQVNRRAEWTKQLGERGPRRDGTAPRA